METPEVSEASSVDEGGGDSGKGEERDGQVDLDSLIKSVRRMVLVRSTLFGK